VKVERSALDDIDSLLGDTDELLNTSYPGERDVRQPVHTVYVPGDRSTPDLPYQWGQQALEFVDEHGGMLQLAGRVITAARKEAGPGLASQMPSLHQVAREAEQLAEAVTAKLEREPIEDLRLDFEDGFGDRGDETEDACVVKAARDAVAGRSETGAPGFVGIRFKCLEKATRERGLRTLDLFLAELIAAGGTVPDNLVLTLPKVSTVDQVRAMVLACRSLEAEHNLGEGTLTFEIQVETPQIVLGADGTVPLAPAIHAGEGRVTSLHYGTYDYSASMGVAAAHQAMDHPVADFAKNQMMLAVAGTGVHLSDGSTNILPLGEPEEVDHAWALHAGLVRRHLKRGIYQGWDLHPHQLPTRFLATFAFYREGGEKAAQRLRNYVFKEDSTVLDEPATAKALARYLERGFVCGAHTEEFVTAHTKLNLGELAQLARTGHLN
jgi:citrate lyase beta subunit